MMIRARGFSFEMPLDREIIRVQEFAKHLEDTKHLILKAMGVQAVSWVVQDYRSRSDGKSAGGIKWKPITAGAIRSRLAGRTPWQKQRSDLQSMKGDRSDQAKKKRASIRAKRKSTIAKELTGARIGVDTGRLVNSLVFGVSELSHIKVGTKSKGTVSRAIFNISGDTITIGSNMEYAGYFDEKRPIFGPGFLNDTRRKDMDSLIEKTIEADAKHRFGGQ